MGGKYEGVSAASASSINISFTYKGQRCREKIKLTPTDENLKKVYHHRCAILDAIARGEFDYAVTFPSSKNKARFAKTPGAVITLETYLENWVTGLTGSLKASTVAGYKKIIFNQLIPQFGDLHVSELSRRHVKEWLATKTDITAKTQGNLISPLREALNDAMDDELIQTNPLAGWKIRRKRTGQKAKAAPVDPFSSDERAAILEACRDEQFKNLITFAFWTGLRTSELVGLNWSHIDWHRQSVFIDEALTAAAIKDGTGHEDPKTVAGAREVDLLPPALAAIKAQRKFSELKGAEVFQDPRYQERWQGDAPIRKSFWTPALTRAKVRYRKPYTTRHTFASMALMAGEDIRAIARMLGHIDWTFTARTYARFIPNDAPRLGAKLCPATTGKTNHE